MLHRRRILFLAALIALPISAATATCQQRLAPTDSILRISLADALTRAEEANLDLRVARQQLAVAEARSVSAGAFPNPGATVTREQLSSGGASYDETSVTLSQPIEIGGQRGARIAVARQGAEAVRARLHADRLRVAFAVHRAYIRAAIAEADLLALSEATEVFRRVEASGRARFAEGDISRFDRSRLQIELVRYETLLATKSLDLADAGRELTLLIAPDSIWVARTLRPAEPLAAIGGIDQTISLDAAMATATARADVIAADAQVEAQRATLSLARLERIPTPTLTAGFKNQADGFQGAVVGIALPLPLWNRNGGAIAEADAQLAAAVAQRDLVLARARNDIRRAWDTYRSLQELTRTLGETLLPESAGLLETARFSYAEGEMSLIELLDAADAYRAARESINALLGDYLTALFDLERATGTLVDLPDSTVTSFR
ncbi:TolC family protein [soil metagenome]